MDQSPYHSPPSANRWTALAHRRLFSRALLSVDVQLSPNIRVHDDSSTHTPYTPSCTHPSDTTRWQWRWAAGRTWQKTNTLWWYYIYLLLPIHIYIYKHTIQTALSSLPDPFIPTYVLKSVRS